MQPVLDTPSATHPELTFRAVTAADRDDLARIAAQTWDGNDYLMDVFEAWLADSEGMFYAGCLPDGRLAGAAKLTRLGSGEWWLEGIRVDPTLRGQGIGRAIHAYGVALAEALQRAHGAGAGEVRFCTDLSNAPVHRMAAAFQFRQVAQFWRYSARVLPSAARAETFRRCTPDQLHALRAFLNSSPHYANVQQSTIEARWQCRRLTDARLRDLAAQGMIWLWHGVHQDAARIDGALIGYVGSPYRQMPPEFNLTYLDARVGSLASIAQAARALGATFDVPSVRHMILARGERLVAIEQAGWRRPKDDSGKACLFSRALNQDSVSDH
jgi:GNAT superfamily N-acetyltransferase